MRNFIYFPSISSRYTKFYFINNDVVFDKNFRYYEDFQLNYKYALLSAGHGMNFKNLRRDMGLEDSFVFGDSGGFQIANSSMKIEDFNLPILFKWLQNNSDIYPILDVPQCDNYIDFDFCIQKTKEHRDFFLSQNNKNKILLNVAQTNNDFDYFIKWFTEIDKEGFNGYGVGGLKDVQLAGRIVQYILKHTKSIVKHIHFFGINNPNDFKVLKQVAEDYSINIYTDTANPFILADNDILLDKKMNKTKNIFNKKECSYINLIKFIETIL